MTRKQINQLPINKYVCVSIITFTLFIPLATYLIGSSVTMLRTSNAELVGVGESITGFNEFKVVSGIFSAGFLIAVPVINSIWGFYMTKVNTK